MKERSWSSARIVGGSLLILFGAGLLLESTGVFDAGPLWRFWPLILVVIGIVKLRNARSRHEEGSALWLLLLGAWFTVGMLHIGGLTFGDIWPAILIALGLSLLWKSIPGRRAANTESEVPHGT